MAEALDVLVDTDPDDPGSWRDTVARACAASLARLAPVLLVVDDAQWLDPSSRWLLDELLATRHDGVVIAVGSREPLELDAPTIDVGPLDEAAVGALVRAADREHDPRTLLARTGGNPHLLTEVLRMGTTDGVPTTVRAIVEKRLAGLTEDVRGAITAAAVLGRDVDGRIVAAVLAVDVADAASLLSAARAADVVVDGAGALGYRFAHDLTREAVLAGVTRFERATLHASVGRALLAQRASDAVVAHHLLAAGDLAPEEALEVGRRAAQSAEAVRGHEEAADLYQRMLEVEVHLPPDASRRAHLVRDLGRALDHAGHTLRAREVLASIADIAPRDDAGLLVDAAVLYAGAPGALLAAGAHDGLRLVALANEALGGDGDDALRCVARATEVACRLHEADPERRLDLADDAIDLARAARRPDLLAHALSAAWSAGEGVRPASTQLAIAEEWAGLVGATGANARFLSLVRLWVSRVAAGQLAEARRASGDLDACAVASDWETVRYYAAVVRGMQRAVDGDIDAARTALTEAEAARIARGPGTGATVMSLRGAIVELELGDIDADVLDEMASTLPFLAATNPVAARRALHDGDVTTAADRFDEWFDGLARIPVSIRWYAAADGARHAARGARPHVLEGLVDLLTPLADQWASINLAMPLGRYELATGAARLSLGDVDGAIDDLSAAHAAHVAAHADGIARRSSSLLSQALAQRGRRSDQALLRTLNRRT
jgi:hypothetical protein